MIESLRQERGQERMLHNNASQRRADVTATPRAFATPATGARSNGPKEAFDLAKEHRDRLLGYQAENAKRTQIIDEASDYETPSTGLSQWSSPVERAAQLKRQQKILREQEWNARPEYEKRKVVVSVDLVGGKVIKKMANAERPSEPAEVVEDASGIVDGTGRISKEGSFSKNPLMGNLIRPVWTAKGSGKGIDNEHVGAEEDKENQTRRSTWRRVQDDEDDNEAWILDGGIYGSREDDRRLGAEEHAQG